MSEKKNRETRVIRLMNAGDKMIEPPGCNGIAVLEDSSTKEKYYAKFNCKTKGFEPCHS